MEVAVPMCADFLHPGHLHLLEAAAKHGKVTVWLMTDAAMQTYKRKPFFKYADRKDILLALCTVSKVLPCNGPNDYIYMYLPMCQTHRPRVFVHGDEWKAGAQSKARARSEHFPETTAFECSFSKTLDLSSQFYQFLCNVGDTDVTLDTGERALYTVYHGSY